MIISAIACISTNGGLGKNNDLLGYIPEDLKFFKKQTLEKAIFMGSKTAKSLPQGNPLPKRNNYVLCRKDEQSYFSEKGFLTIVADSVSDAIEQLSLMNEDEVVIIGGSFVYEQALSLIDTLYLNVGHDLPEDADCFFCNVRSVKSIGEMPGMNIVAYHEEKTKSSGMLSFYKLERITDATAI